MDRIKAIHIENVRAIESMTVDLSDGMTVLIGENGSGKSTIIECLELLRHAPDPHFMERFYDVHRGMPGMLRAGATSLSIGVTVGSGAGEDSDVLHVITLADAGGHATVSDRVVGVVDGRPIRGENPQRSLNSERDGSGRRIDGRALSSRLYGIHNVLAASQADPERPLDPFAELGPRVAAAIAGVEAHVGFDTSALWAARVVQQHRSIRSGSVLRPAESLQLMGRNLAAAWHELRNRDDSEWGRSMELLRLGLGERVSTVVIQPDPGGGEVHLGLRFRGMVDPVMAPNLSDGQLAWLAFVAMTRLNEGRSLLAIDEPDQHLHPHLVAAVVALLQNVKAPVLVSTHSDRWLELLDEPADAVRVCGLDDEGRATIAKLDPEALDTWLADFGDLGQLRAAGYLDRVLRPADADPA